MNLLQTGVEWPFLGDFQPFKQAGKPKIHSATDGAGDLPAF
jgi:hypothetical protein